LHQGRVVLKDSKVRISKYRSITPRSRVGYIKPANAEVGVRDNEQEKAWNRPFVPEERRLDTKGDPHKHKRPIHSSDDVGKVRMPAMVEGKLTSDSCVLLLCGGEPDLKRVAKNYRTQQFLDSRVRDGSRDAKEITQDGKV
jgi:hypothetical protein